MNTLSKILVGLAAGVALYGPITSSVDDLMQRNAKVQIAQTELFPGLESWFEGAQIEYQKDFLGRERIIEVAKRKWSEGGNVKYNLMVLERDNDVDPWELIGFNNQYFRAFHDNDMRRETRNMREGISNLINDAQKKFGFKGTRFSYDPEISPVHHIKRLN